MINFTLAELAVKVQEVAAEYPDRVYANPDPDADNGGDGACKYRHDDGALGCVYGHALARLGVDLAGLSNMAIHYHLARWFGGEAGDDAYFPFREVQRFQDQGAPWGEAVLILAGHYPQTVTV